MSKQFDEVGNFSIKVTVFIILVIVSLAAILIHIFIPTCRGEIEFATAVIGGAALVYAGYYTAVSMRFSIDQHKKDNSFKILQELNTLDLVRIRVLVERDLQAKHLTPKQVHEKILADRELLHGVTNILGIFEDLSIAIKQDYVDEEVLYESLIFLVPWIFDELKPYIEEERRVDKRLYTELEKLRDAWKGQKSLKSGGKLPQL